MKQYTIHLPDDTTALSITLLRRTQTKPCLLSKAYSVMKMDTYDIDLSELDRGNKNEIPQSSQNQSAKADAGKLEIDLVPTQIIRDIAEVRMYGNRKYGSPDNWKTVELRRYINAMLRHTLAFLENPRGVDEESGLSHYKHAECNLAFISEMMKEIQDAKG